MWKGIIQGFKEKNSHIPTTPNFLSSCFKANFPNWQKGNEGEVEDGMKEEGESNKYAFPAKDYTLLSGWIAKDPATKLCLPF